MSSFCRDFEAWVCQRQPPTEESNGEAGEMSLNDIICHCFLLVSLLAILVEAKKNKKTEKNQQILGRSAGG